MMFGKDRRKIIQELLLMFWLLKKKKYALPIFQNITQIVKKQVLILRIPNGEIWHFPAIKYYQCH